MVHMSPAGAVESVAPLELLNAGSSTHTTPLGISSDGRYVLVSANAGGTKLRVDRLTGQQLEVDRSARLLSADGQVIVGPQLVNGNPTQVRREDLRSGAVQVFPTPGGSSIVRGIDEVSAISADGNVIVLTVIDGGRGSVEVWGLDARNGNVIEPASGFGAGTTYASFGGSISANGRFLTWVQRNGVSAGCTMSVS